MAFSYLDQLCKELDSYHIDKVATIYVGGGTPSALPDALFDKLLHKLAPLLKEGGEFSVELNAESTTQEKC
jgi:oxygen-independent coproporphyrinogen-3 oxidase